MHSSELLKGTVQTIVLKVLKDRDRTYGYEITQRVKELSEGRILLTEGALYPSLHKLEAEGLVRAEVVTVTRDTQVLSAYNAGKKFWLKIVSRNLWTSSIQ